MQTGVAMPRWQNHSHWVSIPGYGASAMAFVPLSCLLSLDDCKSAIYTLVFGPAPSNWVRRRRSASSTHILALRGHWYDTIRYNKHSNKQACASAFRKAQLRACSPRIRPAHTGKSSLNGTQMGGNGTHTCSLHRTHRSIPTLPAP